MVGYRGEYLFGDCITDPGEVAFYELRDLGNLDIPEYLLSHYEVSAEHKEYLESIVDGDIDDCEIDKEYYKEIISRIIQGRDFCKWLCKAPKDVYDCYVEPFGRVSYEAFKEEINCYEIPHDAIILSDLGKEGILWCWKE